MRKFINDLVDKIGTYPIREPFKELKDYDDVTKTKVWSTLPILNFLSDNWMLPVIQSRGYIEQFTVFGKFIYAITSRILRIRTEHIDWVYS